MEAIDVGFWSVIPPIIAIALALITKEVIFSLVVGIFSGTLIYTIAGGASWVGVFQTTVDLMSAKMGDNAAMILFLALLGSLVAVITMAGGSRAYGDWAARKLKSRRSVGVATGLLGVIIFIDDYFNCLTVGTVMRPVTDKYNMSREKLSYIIDATAAPVCIIAPISSWAASVISYYPETNGMNGMQAFISAIPMNLYAILTLFMVFWLVIRRKGDYGPMATAERRAQMLADMRAGEAAAESDGDIESPAAARKGKVIDLILPVIALIIFAIFSMLLYGGMFSGEGKSLFQAFGDTSAAPALALAALGAVIVAFFQFVPRRLLSFKDFFAGVGKGIKNMVPAIIILCLAWTISGVCRDLLGTGDYVASLVAGTNIAAIIPAVMFIVAALVSFATGTSWGTFGILIPIVLAILESIQPSLTITGLSAVLAGSVFGDHCSPISDTTILSSTGADVKHINHVSTQIPYAITVAVVCVIGYLIAGFTNALGYGASVAISLGVSLALLIVLLLVLPRIMPGKSEEQIAKQGIIEERD